MREDLVDAAARHHVAAQEQRDIAGRGLHAPIPAMRGIHPW
jgi:hypothetical protein